MKILIFIACFIALIEFSGAHALLDTHVLSWLPASVVDIAYGAIKFLVTALIIAYGILYLYYAQKNADKAG